jgi:predicted nucleic acid-binding protein
VKVLVLDTSALVAGLLKRHGPAARLVNAFFANRFQLAYTSAILGEYAEVLARDEFGFEPAEQFAKLRTSGLAVVPHPIPSAAWPDPDDLPFVAAVLATADKVLVTLNPRDFAPAAKFGARIVSPRQAMAYV